MQGRAGGLTNALVLLVRPISLLLTAIYVDECIDMGLDAADKPSFGLFRAAAQNSAGNSTNVRSRCC